MSGPSTSLKQGRWLSNFFSRLALSSNGQGSEHRIEPPVPRLLQSNDPPSEAERIQIENAIMRAEDRKLRLTAALKNASSASQVEDINKATKDVDTYISSHRSTLSTLRGLPQELLSLIFIFCLESITNPWKGTNWCDLPSFLVSQVCQRWRIVALNTPQLWCVLGNIQFNNKTKSKAYIKFLNTYLSRSRGLDLWIYVYAPDQLLDQHQIIEPLVHHAERWKVVTFETTPTTVNAFRNVKHRLLRLRRLSLNLKYSQGIIDFFSNAPVLTDFSLCGDYHYDSSIVPWGQLKTFSEEVVYGTMLDSVIKYSSSRLETLLVKFNPNAISPAMTSAINSPVTFSKLKTFHLILPTSRVDPDVDSFFQVLTLPHLEELRIRCFKGAFFESLLELFRRSSLSLQHVPLKRLYLNSHCSLSGSQSALHFVSLLRLVPRLQHLEVELSTLFCLLLDALFMNANYELPVIPELESLTVHWDWFGDKDHEVFAYLLRICNKLANKGTGQWNGRTLSGVEIDDYDRPLRRLKFIFKNREQAIKVQRHLNGWVPTPGSAGEDGCSGFWLTSELHRYEEWRQNLLHGLSSLTREEDSDFLPDPMAAPRLDKLLADIQSTELMDVHLVYGSSLHFTLLDLHKQYIPHDDKYMFRARAGAILDKWKEAINADLENGRSVWRKNWVLKGERCLQYMVNYDAIRKSPQALDLIWGWAADSEESAGFLS